MGYIELPSGAPDTKQAVISLWFRVPGSSIDAATAEWQEFINNPASILANAPPMLGVVPLAVFGPPTLVKNIKGDTVTIATIPFQSWSVGPDGITLSFEDTVPVDGPTYSFSGGSKDGEPSYIGVDCRGTQPALSVNITMPGSNVASYGGGAPFGALTSATSTSAFGIYTGLILNCTSVDGPLPSAYTFTTTSETNFANIVLGAFPETFRLLPGREFQGPNDFATRFAERNNFNGQQITPDHWHHLLLSFDLTNNISLTGGHTSRTSEEGCNPDDGTCVEGLTATDVINGKVSSSCKMYVALDDQNITGAQLTVYRPDGGGPNDIITVHGYSVYREFGTNTSDTTCIRLGRQQTSTTIVATPTYKYTPSNVPLSQGALAFPSSSSFVNQVKHVEMGEFQLFTGVHIDTGIDANRRAFITKDGTPESMSAAATLLNKEPEVKLHGSGNWKKAHNTGTYRIVPSGSDSPDGVHVGDIKTYKPKPSLNGKQGQPQ